DRCGLFDAYITSSVYSNENLKYYYTSDFVDNIMYVDDLDIEDYANDTSEKSYNIENYEVNILKDSPINFVVHIWVKDIQNENITFYLNKAFKVSTIFSDNNQLSFQQTGNEVTVTLNSMQEQELVFNYEGVGTALNPVNENYVFLPYFFRWLPTNSSTEDYVFNENSLDYQPFENECVGIKNFQVDLTSIIVQESHDCFSIIKGDFISDKVSDVTYHIPKTWAGNAKNPNYYYTEIRSEIVDFFNKEFDTSYTLKPKSVVFFPRFEDSPILSLNDVRLNNDQDIVFINPFINIKDKNLSEHIYSKTLFATPFALIRENVNSANFEDSKIFSGLVTIHFAENEGYILNQEILNKINTLLPQELQNFQKLSEDNRQIILHDLYNSIINNN
ncbi:hypothetical protein, partial [Pontibacillus litoralis]|uniref:hypothetical protein n=1 Tax=Pontibacillus litoralis TaxID=516703 RepID=UPI000567816E